MKLVLEITHHSGKKRWLNLGEGQWESIDVDDNGQAVIHMASGQQHMTQELAPDVIAAIGAKISRVRATLASPPALIEDNSQPEPEVDPDDPDIIPPQVRGNQ